MTIALAAIVAAALGFELGWYAHARQQTHGKVTIQLVRPKVTPQAIAYYLTVVVIIGSIIYGDVRTDSKVGASEARQNDRNTAQLACLSKTFEEFLSGNQKLRDANARWQQALTASKEANAQLILVRPGRGAGLPR
jgi:hypothetical protein